jgi:hypothetical protein
MAILDRLPGDFLGSRAFGQSLPRTEEASPLAEVVELHLLDGVWREEGPDVAVLPNAARGGGTLAVVLEFRDRPEEWACRLVIESVVRALRAERASLTKALAQGLEAAHAELLVTNAGRVDFERAGVGATCAVVQGGDVTLAQVGPAVAFAVAGHRLKRFTTLGEVDRGPCSWLGECGEPAVRFSRQRLGEGDLLLLASSGILELPTAHWVMSGLADGASGLVRSLRLKAPFRAYLTAVAIAPRVEGLIPGPAAPPMSDIGNRISDPPADIRYPTSDMATEGDAGAALGLPVYRRAAEPVATERPRLRLVEQGERGARSGERGAGRGAGDNQLQPRAVEPVRRPAARPVAGLAETVVATGGGMAVAAPRGWRLGRIGREMPRVGRPKGGWRWWVFSALMLPAAFGLGAAAVSLPGLLAQKEQETIVDGVREAGLAIDRAAGLAEPGEVRRELSAARRLLDRALVANPGDAEAAALRVKVSDRLQQMNREFELQAVRTVGDLAAVNREASVSGLAAQGAALYAVDAGAAAVYRLDPSGQAAPQAVARRGEAAGHLPVGLPFAAGFVPGEEPDRPVRGLVIDSNRNLVEVREGRPPAPLKIRGAADLKGFRAADFYGGNLYVLDPQDSQIWRYLPTYNGFDSERKGILDNVSLKDAVAFSIDGDIYVLEGSGKIRKFSLGREQPFGQAGLDRPLDKATALYAGRQNKHVYVADGGNRRIVVFDKYGDYQRQYPLEHLETVRAVYADEPNRLLYFADGQRVYAATLPD